jgi:hypothetical protein
MFIDSMKVGVKKGISVVVPVWLEHVNVPMNSFIT